MPLDPIQEQKLRVILGKMVDSGLEHADIKRARDLFVQQVEQQQAQQAALQQQEMAQQPAYQMGGNWANAPTGFAKGLLDVPVGIYQMGKHALSAMASPTGAGGMDLARDIYGSTIGPMVKASRPMEMLQSTPEDISRFAGQMAGGALLGKGIGKAVGAVGEYAHPRNTLNKVNAMTIEAYGEALKPSLPGQPSSLEIANPYILAESKGKPWTELDHHVIKAKDASGNFSDMMRGLEDQFRNVPLDLSQAADAVKNKIASITDPAVRAHIEKWANETFKSSNVGDALTKRAELNQEVRTYYRKNQMSQADAMGDPTTAADINAVNEVRNLIDKTIDQHAGGNINTQAMYQIESALKDVVEAGPKALERNALMKTRKLGTRGGVIGGEAAGDVAQAAAGGGNPYLIRRTVGAVTRPITKTMNMPDNLIAKAGKLMQEGGKIRQPGKEAVQEPMRWYQNPPPATGVGVGFGGAGGGGVQGVSPGVAGSMPPAIRQPMQGQVVNPPPAAAGAPFVSRDIPPPMPNLVQVGPGRWVAQDVLEAGNPPGQMGPGRTFELGPYSPATASEMELNQAAINRPTPRPVGKPPRSSWRMKPDVRAAQPQPGELDVTATPEPVETQPFNVMDKRTQFTAPPENPTVPSSMQEQPINRESIIRPPEGPTRKVGKPPRPLKVKDVRTVKPTESELDPYAGAAGPAEPDMTLGGYASLNNVSPAAQTFLGIKNRPVGPVETKPAPIGGLEAKELPQREGFMPVYRGAGPRGMKELRPSEEGSHGPGVYFYDNPIDARAYAGREGGIVSGYVKPEDVQVHGTPRHLDENLMMSGGRVVVLKDPTKFVRHEETAQIGNLPDEPIVEKAPDWPGMGEGYHVRWPEMEKGSTVYVTPGETLADKINKFKTDFPRQ